MDVFSLREHLIRDYASYIDSFIEIREPRIKEYVQQSLEQGVLWPEPLIQLNPSFEPGDWIDDLVSEGVLHDECRNSSGSSRSQRAWASASVSTGINQASSERLHRIVQREVSR